MISAEALAALSGIENGAKYNTLHTTARELMSLGFACDDWGCLGLTEAGRIYLRRGRFNIAITSDEHVCDMSVHQMQIPDADIDRTPSKYWQNRTPVDNDPMAAPHRVNKGLQAKLADLELPPEAPAEPLPVAESQLQKMLRAAGVASGKTGVWVKEDWVEEFIRALDEPE